MVSPYSPSSPIMNYACTRRDVYKYIIKAQEAHSRAAGLLKSVKDVSTEELLKTPIAENLFEGDKERLLWNALQEVFTMTGTTKP